ncbi:MAG: Ribosomal silencing factor during starvation, partial [Candidatus Eremiobacteraeota bacterium]|nr:Ribosomal silencing factor during starvation [Candidatus Eremiobacteraeota bacterium]
MREAAEDKKAEDISILDLAGRTIVADTFVVVTG